jgi:hypothetical protein
MMLPPAAAAQDRTPTPSARELWNTYPLRQEPAERRPAEDRATGTSTAAPGTRGPARQVSVRSPGPADDDGTPLVLVGAAAALAALGAASVLRRRRVRPPRAPVAFAMPLLAAAATTAALPERRRPPRLTALTGEGGGSERDGPEDEERRAQELRPPDPAQPWTAELEWRGEGDGPRFCVTARPDGGGPDVRIASSEPIEWPPQDAVAVQRLRRSVAQMEAAVRSAGWTPLTPGESWYSKRFAWAPVAEPAPAPAPSRRLFEPQPAWPSGAEDLWRCEIRWRAGYVNSRFTLVARRPGRRGSTTVSSSKTFKWLIMADPDPPSPEFRDAVERLDEQIAAAGWEPAGSGREWWERRYVWRGDGPPPLDLDPAPARVGDPDGGDDDAS